MPASSTHAVYNGSNAGTDDSNKRRLPHNAGTQATVQVPSDPSYSMHRFLQGSGERPPPGLGQAQSEHEATQRMQELLRAFGAQFGQGDSSAAGRD